MSKFSRYFGRSPDRLELEDVRAYQVYLVALSTADQKGATGAIGLLRGLIDAVVLRPVEDGFEIELVGDIARMVGLSLTAADSKKAALDERTACSVKLVAGARNHLYRTNLRWVRKTA